MRSENNSGRFATFRLATSEDAEIVAEVYLASRKTFVSFAPLKHSDDAIRMWVKDTLIPMGRVTVVEAGSDHREVIGFMAVSRRGGQGWIDHLYMRPGTAGQAHGSDFVERAKAELGSPIRLYTFARNSGARRFYERHGFTAIKFTDGPDDEEGYAAVLYEWRPEASGST